LAFETRAWDPRLRWSELWGSLKVITILGLFSGIWLFHCFHQFHIASFRFYERISQRDSRFLPFGWFTSTSCAHTVFIADFDNQPIRFSISICHS